MKVKLPIPVDLSCASKRQNQHRKSGEGRSEVGGCCFAGALPYYKSLWVGGKLEGGRQGLYFGRQLGWRGTSGRQVPLAGSFSEARHRLREKRSLGTPLRRSSHTWHE